MKFKIWNTEYKEWDEDHCDFYIKSNGALCYDYRGKVQECPTCFIPVFSTEVKDKNGVEIYEGDIFNVPYNKIGNKITVFKNGAWNIARYALDRIEIIGNIHQNPELLK